MVRVRLRKVQGGDDLSEPLKPFRYSEFPPSRSLADFVANYWTFDVRLPEGESFAHRIWPDGCTSVGVVVRNGAGVAGRVVGPVLAARVVDVDGGISYRGVRFWPDTGATACGMPAESLRGASLAAEEVFGPALRPVAAGLAAVSDNAEIASLFDAWLGERLPRDATAPDPLVRSAILRIIEQRGATPIPEVAEYVGLGLRQLQRRFRDAVGLTPKEYARIRRIRSALGGVMRGEIGWASLALEFGYADQSHLINDFGDLTGLTPVALRERLAIIEHVGVSP